MFSLLLLLLLSSISLRLSLALYIPVPIPEVGDLFDICHERICLDNALKECERSNKLLIIMVVNDVLHDPYIPIHLGWVMHLMAGNAVRSSYFVLLDTSVFANDETLIRSNLTVSHFHRIFFAAVSLFQMPALGNVSLPWVFLALQHGDSALPINALVHMQKLNPHIKLNYPKVLVHLNHEKPWNTKVKDFDYMYRTVHEFREAYATFPLVIRNYYYKPVISQPSVNLPQYAYPQTLFLPLGPSKYGYLVGNSTAIRHTLASDRTTQCYFAGKKHVDKNTYVTNESGANTSDQMETIAHCKANLQTQQRNALNDTNMCSHQQASSSYLQQRSDLFLLLERGQHNTIDEHFNEEERALVGLAACKFQSVDMIQQNFLKTEKEAYTGYLHTLSNTVFALCPAGNSPETFRIYEAIERGAIPILLRSEPDLDFIESDMWGGPRRATRHLHPESSSAGGEGSLPDCATNAHCANERLLSDVRSSAYPGPVFSTWEEVDAFLIQMSPPDERLRAELTGEELHLRHVSRTLILNEMQREVQEWYVEMRKRARSTISRAINDVFNPQNLVGFLEESLRQTRQKLSAAQSLLNETQLL